MSLAFLVPSGLFLFLPHPSSSSSSSSSSKSPMLVTTFFGSWSLNFHLLQFPTMVEHEWLVLRSRHLTVSISRNSVLQKRNHVNVQTYRKQCNNESNANISQNLTQSPSLVLLGGALRTYSKHPPHQLHDVLIEAEAEASGSSSSSSAHPPSASWASPR